MTSLGQMGQASENSNQPPQGAHKSPRGTRRRPTGRFSLLRNKGTWFWIVVSLIALAGVALVVDGGSHQAISGATSAATGGAPAASSSLKASQANQAPNSSRQANQTLNSSHAKGKVPSPAQAAESAGALRPPANMQSSVLAWQSGPGGTDLAAVTRLFGDALQAEALRQYVDMRIACTQLAHSVSTAEAGPQIPVAAMQTVYGQALTELAKGAADCQAGISIKQEDETFGTKVNATMRKQAASELAAGARDIFRSTALIEIASRQHH